MLKDSSALRVQIIKGIYFPNKNLLEAGKGAKSSWAWSSLLEGRDFLKKKLLWKVMDGSGVSIWDNC